MTKKLTSNSYLRAFYLGIPFVILYFVIRFIPVKPCDFLHEETYNLEGELDFCGSGDAEFVDLSVRKWPLKMDFKPIDVPTPGKPCRFEINIKQFDGSPLGPDDIALSHTKKIHLLAIDQSLKDYQHLHPEADQLFDGTWRFSMTPKKSGRYKVFLDLIPLRSPRRVLLAASFEVDGKPESKTGFADNLTSRVGNKTFSLQPIGPAKSGDEVSLKLIGVGSDGNPIVLTPVMGAFAHMVAFDSNLKGFAHLHPSDETLPRSKEDAHSGPLHFTFVPPQEGSYRLWAQVLLEDMNNEVFIPFDLKVDS